MGRENIDVENLRVTGATPKDAAEAITIRDEVLVIVNQAFGPGGEHLVGVSDVTFDGFAALTIKIRAGEREELVHLSPIHGDRRKVGMEGLLVGTKCKLMTPKGVPLDRADHVVLDGEAVYFAMYLTPRLERGSMIYISDVWGHHHSRVVDNNELISHWAAVEEATAAG